MTQTMLPVDRARTRMPFVCTVIAVLVWTVFAGICITAWLLKSNGSASGFQGTPSNSSAAKSAEPYPIESRARPGYRF